MPPIWGGARACGREFLRAALAEPPAFACKIKQATVGGAADPASLYDANVLRCDSYRNMFRGDFFKRCFVRSAAWTRHCPINLAVKARRRLAMFGAIISEPCR